MAILLCVGSRDRQIGREWCSKICCTVSCNLAMEIREELPDCHVYIYYMDIRTFGLYETRYYWASQEEFKVKYIKARIAEVTSDGQKLIVKGEDTLVKRPITIPFDMVVHAIGMDPNVENKAIAGAFGIELERHGFIARKTSYANLGESSREGVFVAGSACGPGNDRRLDRPGQGGGDGGVRARPPHAGDARGGLNATMLVPRASVPAPAASAPLPQLDLSGPKLREALRALVASAEEHGGVERYVDALRVKSKLFRDFLGDGKARSVESGALKALCALVATARRRVGPYLEPPRFEALRTAIAELVDGCEETGSADARIAAFCARYPLDRAHRWVRDLAAEILHNVDPERYPLMTRWVWDVKTNTGVLREIWHADDVDQIMIAVPDRYDTFLMLRQELAQFLAANGVFRDVLFYVDLLAAQVYADVHRRAGRQLPAHRLRHARGHHGARATHARPRRRRREGPHAPEARGGRGVRRRRPAARQLMRAAT